MKKRFYVVIGWENIELQKLSFVDKFLNRGNSVSLLKISEKDFKARGDELRERANVTASGLGSIGLHCKQLTTSELIELFYGFYNPGIADKERLVDMENIQANIISQKAKVDTESSKIDLEKPINTVDETPVIDNTDFVKEQDKIKKQAIAAESALLAAAQKQAEITPEPPTQSTGQNNTNSQINNANK